MSTFAFKGTGDFTPFQWLTYAPAVVQLTSSQSSQWNLDRANYIGPMSLDQLCALLWQVRGFKLEDGVLGFFGGEWQEYDWDDTMDPPQYVIGPLVFTSDTLSTVASGDMDGDDESDLMRNGFGTNPYHYNTGGTSDAGKFGYSISFGLFNHISSQLRDDSGSIIDIPFIYVTPYLIICDDAGQYYIQGGVDISSSPLTGPSPAFVDIFTYVGPQAYYFSGSGPQYPNASPVEIVVPTVNLDVILGDPAGTPMFKFTASKFWEWDGRFDSMDGHFLGF